MGQLDTYQADSPPLFQGAYLQGRQDYAKGKPISGNPYCWFAFGTSDEGIRRDGWLKGWRDAWMEEDCPEARWPGMSTNVAVIEHRIAVSEIGRDYRERLQDHTQ